VKSVRVVAAIVTALALVAGPLALPANAAGTVLCRTYDQCEQNGMTHHGYPASSSGEYWRMVSGHNCTNYVAWMLIQAGMSSTRPWNGNGNANAWGHYNTDITDSTPTAGSVAWWDANDGVGALGHVAYVESVTANSIRVSEDNYRGEFFWRVIYDTDPAWPTGFIHFKDAATSTSFPAWRSRPLTQSVYTDATKAQSASVSTLEPGSTFWVTMTYQNTGDATWSGVSLKTATESSALNAGWIAPNIAAVQKQSAVVTGGTATFNFPVAIPAGVPDGTQFTETFTPIDNTGAAIQLGDVTMTFTADSRDPFTVQPPLTVLGTPKQGQVLTAASGLWDPVQPLMTYQWLRDGKPIAGATAATYIPTGGDVGTTTSVTTTASADGFIPVTQSATTGVVTRSIYGTTLLAKKKLASDAQLVSANGVYRLVHGKKGNLAVVNRFTKKTVWSSKKYSKGAYTRLRSDGVLVTYSKSGKVIWSTKSATKGKKVVRAVITNTGKLALYSKSGKLAWRSSK
jgi:surface antigen